MNRRSLFGMAFGAIAAPLAAAEATIIRGRSVFDPRQVTVTTWTELTPEIRAELAATLKAAMADNHRRLVDEIRRGRV